MAVISQSQITMSILVFLVTISILVLAVIDLQFLTQLFGRSKEKEAEKQKLLLLQLLGQRKTSNLLQSFKNIKLKFNSNLKMFLNAQTLLENFSKFSESTTDIIEYFENFVVDVKVIKELEKKIFNNEVERQHQIYDDLAYSMKIIGDMLSKCLEVILKIQPIMQFSKLQLYNDEQINDIISEISFYTAETNLEVNFNILEQELIQLLEKDEKCIIQLQMQLQILNVDPDHNKYEFQIQTNKSSNEHEMI